MEPHHPHPSRPHLLSLHHPASSPSSPQLAHIRSGADTPVSSPGAFYTAASPTPLSMASPLNPDGEPPSAIPFNISSTYLPLQPVRETHTANVERDYAGRKTINEYQVIEEIGRGQHGKVKLARNISNGHMVAIKIIPRLSKTRRLGKVSAVDPQQNTKREIAILKKIRHENVVALLEVIDDPELQKIYMVLENAERGEIVWRKKGLPNICYFERYRTEKGMHGQVLPPGEFTWTDVLERKETIRALKEARATGLPPPVNRWTTNFGVTADDDDQLPWWYVADNGPDIDPAETSRAPSRVPSATSVSTAPTPASYDSDPSPLSMLVESGGSGTDTPNLLHPSHVAASALEGSMYGPYTDGSSGLRRRSPSVAASIFSHTSNFDFNAVVHDPYADDFSYVPCFSIEQARTTFRDTVLGLEYLHYHGVVHRDIKPANLLWTKNFRVKISDFGVSYFGRPIRDGEPDPTVSEAEALDFDDDRELSKTVGTPAFFAPELCYTDIDTEPPKVSEQIDVWSLGVTLYCLLYARIPFLAEDEFSMFRKIATDNPYIPSSRLRPVGIFTDPTGSSLYQRTNVLPYRNDADPEYEEISPSLMDLLRKMLIKNPEKRIRLRDVKRHPWVTEDIESVGAWLEKTDPARTQDRRIQVDDAEIGEAVVPLNFLQRAKSAVKRAVGNIIHSAADRDDTPAPTGTGRRRAASSAASSTGDAPLAQHSQLSVFGVPMTLHHSNSTGSHNNHTHNHNHSHSFSLHRHSSSFNRDLRRPSIMGEDYFATVTQHPFEHPLAQTMTVTAYDPPVEKTPGSKETRELTTTEGPQASPRARPETPGPSAAGCVDGPADETETPSRRPISRHAHSRSITNAVLSRDHALRSTQAPATPAAAQASASSSVATSAATTVRNPRHIRSVTDAGRAQSADRAGEVFASPDKRAGPVVRLGTPQAPGSVQQPESALPSPHFFSAAAIEAYHHSDVSPDTQTEQPMTGTLDERPATAHRVQPHMLAAVSQRVSRSASNSVSAGAAPHGTSLRNLAFAFPAYTTGSPPTNWPAAEDDTIAPTGASSSSASIGDLAHSTPVTTPGEFAGSGPGTAGTWNSCKEGCNAMLAYQSDPSLPALLSGASSVSADVEGEFLGNPGVVDGTALIDASTLAPAALGKTSAADGQYPDAGTVSAFKDQHEWASGGAIPVELDSRNIRCTSAPPRSSSSRVSLDDDDQDSESDGGLVMAKPRRRGGIASREANSTAHSNRVQMARRRDTNTSIGSTDTAKKVPVHQWGG